MWSIKLLVICLNSCVHDDWISYLVFGHFDVENVDTQSV